MLDLNQRPPLCKLGQGFPGRYCPIGKSSLSERFLAFLAPLLSCSVRVCPASVSARLQHLNLCRPAPFSPTPSGSDNTLVTGVSIPFSVYTLKLGILLGPRPCTVRRSGGMPVFDVIALVGQVGEIGEAPGALVGEPSGQLAGDRGEAQMSAADRAGHGSRSVHVASDSYRCADGLPVVVGTPQEGVEAPEDAGHDERCDLIPPLIQVTFKANSRYAADGLLRGQGHPARETHEVIGERGFHPPRELGKPVEEVQPLDRAL